MYKSGLPRNISFLFILLLYSVVNAGQSIYIVRAATERIVINSYEVDLGLQVDISLVITNAENIAGGSIEMNFNKSIIAIEDVIEGDFGTPAANIDNEEGKIYIAVARATAVIEANATLAILKCKGISEGYTDLHIGHVELNDERGNIIVPEVSDQGGIHVIPEFPLITGLVTLIVSTIVIIIAMKLGPFKGGQHQPLNTKSA